MTLRLATLLCAASAGLWLFHTQPSTVVLVARQTAATARAAIPATLGDALDALEADQAFLTKDGVFSEAFLSSYIEGKRAEVADEASRPTASEFYRYYDV